MLPASDKAQKRWRNGHFPTPTVISELRGNIVCELYEPDGKWCKQYARDGKWFETYIVRNDMKLWVRKKTAFFDAWRATLMNKVLAAYFRFFAYGTAYDNVNKDAVYFKCVELFIKISKKEYFDDVPSVPSINADPWLRATSTREDMNYREAFDISDVKEAFHPKTLPFSDISNEFVTAWLQKCALRS